MPLLKFGDGIFTSGFSYYSEMPSSGVSIYSMHLLQMLTKTVKQDREIKVKMKIENVIPHICHSDARTRQNQFAI
jgi:hypothetical protein